MGEGEERGLTTFEVAGAAGLKVETETSGYPSPEDEDDSEENAHVGESLRHGEDSSADDCAQLELGFFLVGTNGRGRGPYWY